METACSVLAAVLAGMQHRCHVGPLTPPAPANLHRGGVPLSRRVRRQPRRAAVGAVRAGDGKAVLHHGCQALEWQAERQPRGFDRCQPDPTCRRKRRCARQGGASSAPAAVQWAPPPHGPPRCRHRLAGAAAALHGPPSLGEAGGLQQRQQQRWAAAAAGLFAIACSGCTDHTTSAPSSPARCDARSGPVPPAVEGSARRPAKALQMARWSSIERLWWRGVQ